MKNPAKYPTVTAVMRAIDADQCGPRYVGHGWCLACGKKVTGVEPDATNYTCSKCGEQEVFGAEEILMMGATR